MTDMDSEQTNEDLILTEIIIIAERNTIVAVGAVGTVENRHKKQGCG